MIKRLLSKRNVYFDHNATTHIASPVRSIMNRVMKSYWGNPSSGYAKGKMSAQIIERAREQVAAAIGAHSHEVYFASCATESNNALLKTVSDHFYPEKNKIISTPIEHPSVINTLEYLKGKNITVQYCPVDRAGHIILEELEAMVDDRTFLVCCMLANNEIGTVQDVKKVAAIAKSKGALVFSDCVQALGKIPVNVKELGVDYATFSAHKLYGPKGIGAWYARISSPLIPFLHGGHQEEGMRAGTESIHNIAGFGEACKHINKLVTAAAKNQSQKKIFLSELKTMKEDLIINSPMDNCLTNTINVSFPGIGSGELMKMLDYNGIAVSAGSACSTSLKKPSHVLKAIGLTDEAAQESIRISLGIETKDKDIRYALKVIKQYIEQNK
ncbi:cysteine desulfurase family protein [Chitinophaga varians]|uniref:cysteine desulfurase family protein n=1 Tax=Chitinophaga varians TaxID=2202339 RepID=UPI00165F8F25|nr:cysteine desulfurase family protein [Chitinophaga varians]MBC9915292.1 cysteine desulfurase [Chitinophaga varians]